MKFGAILNHFFVLRNAVAPRCLLELFLDLRWFVLVMVLETPNRANYTLSGARHIHFEVFFHRVTSWIEVEWLVGIPVADETTKNPLCQEKSGFQESHCSRWSWTWERRQYGQDFFSIWQRLRDMTCIKVPSHIGQNYARLEYQIFTTAGVQKICNL